MKKCITILLLIFICFTLTACNSSKDDNNSLKVQQITYSDGEYRQTLYSKFYFDYIIEEVDAIEYENATEKLGRKYYSYGIIEVNGTVRDQADSMNCFNIGNTSEELKEFVGKTYYCIDGNGDYKKITYTALHTAFLNITFINDDTFEVFYYDKSLKGIQKLRIKSDNYKIVYFSVSE